MHMHPTKLHSFWSVAGRKCPLCRNFFNAGHLISMWCTVCVVDTNVGYHRPAITIYLLKNLVKKKLTLAKNMVLDVSATTVAFLSKDKKYKCLTASCLEYVTDV